MDPFAYVRHFHQISKNFFFLVSPLFQGSTSQYHSICNWFRVNSRELRRVVDEAIENAELKPNLIRFFRGAMFNMVSTHECLNKLKFENLKDTKLTIK